MIGPRRAAAVFRIVGLAGLGLFGASRAYIESGEFNPSVSGDRGLLTVSLAGAAGLAGIAGLGLWVTRGRRPRGTGAELRRRWPA